MNIDISNRKVHTYTTCISKIDDNLKNRSKNND